MMRIGEWLLGVIAVVTSVAGVFLTLQQLQGIQYSGPMFSALFADLWPLPSLVLIGWVLLSLLGFLGIAMDARRSSPLNKDMTGDTASQGFQRHRLTSVAGGALFALAVLGMFSIGPLVLIAALALGSAAILATFRTDRSIGQTLLALLFGAAINFLVLILLAMRARVS